MSMEKISAPPSHNAQYATAADDDDDDDDDDVDVARNLSWKHR